MAAGLILSLAAAAATAGETRSIAGRWSVELDPGRVGEAQKWFGRDLAQPINLPGSTDQARLGPVNQAAPTLDGLYRLHPYEGPVWYQYTILIPGSWAEKQVSLFLERVHGESRVWIDGEEVPGAQDSLISPHVHDLGLMGKPGTRRLTVRVDNTRKLDLGPFTSIRYEGTQTNWNGMIGALELRAVDPVSIEDLQVEPDITRKVARVRLRLRSHHTATVGDTLTAKVRLGVKPRNGREELVSDAFEARIDGMAEVVRELALGPEARAWDEFAPALHVLNATISAEHGGKTYFDERAVRFGMRSFEADGTRFTLNGRPIFLRGTLECGIFPRTGFPPTDVASWRRIFGTIKSYGLNFMRFHSWCPPEAAFAAADQEGVILQVEGPQANVEAGVDPARDAFLEAELLRIVRTYGNHPSFCLMALGNEFGGDDALLSRWVGMLRKEDPRHLYSSAAAAQVTANRQFTEGGPRGVNGAGTTRDFRQEVARQDRPLVGHEIGQWTFYPKLDEIAKYDGVLAARNFELVREDLKARGMLDLAPAFVEATGRHAILLYKEEIELLLRTPKYAGFSLLDLHDYPGQGTALVGLLDPFWDSKGLIKPERHARYCGPTVPLLRMPKRTYTADEAFEAEAELAHFGPTDLDRVVPAWSIRNDAGAVIVSGKLEPLRAPTGGLTRLGAVSTDFEKVKAPARLTVSLALEGTAFVNEWEIWVYAPARELATPPAVTVTRSWDEAKPLLLDGKPVLLLPRLVNHRRSLPGRFLPVFWSPIWFPDQKPNTMGILCDPAHSALAGFPTDAHSNWQWYDLLDSSRSVILDDMPADYRPIVRVIDNFARNHKLANVFEVRVGPGKLLVCTIDLPGRAETSPAARQLLQGLVDYAGSEKFQPRQDLALETLEELCDTKSFSVMQRLGARVHAVDSQHLGNEAALAIDGDPATLWHTGWDEPPAKLPHEIVVALDEPARLAGLRCLPRQDGNPNGWIKTYRVETSGDGASWTMAAEGTFERTVDEKVVAFANPVTARFVKLVALSGFDDKPFTSLAELSLDVAR